MRSNFTLSILVAGLLLAGCATQSSAPNAEAQKVLAPTGYLRVGIFVNNPIQVTKDPATGELKGVAIDVSRELAGRFGVKLETLSYQTAGALADSANSGVWSVAFLAYDPARATDLEFAPLMDAEAGYLVRTGSPVKSLADVDRPGIRVLVLAKGGTDLLLTRELKNATLVRSADLAAGIEAMKSGKADAFAATKPILFDATGQIPGSRVLDGRFATTGYALVIPKSKAAAKDWLWKFVEELKASGFVKSSIEQAGLRGVVVAPAQ